MSLHGGSVEFHQMRHWKVYAKQKQAERMSQRPETEQGPEEIV